MKSSLTPLTLPTVAEEVNYLQSEFIAKTKLVPTAINYTPDECRNNVASSGSVKATETLGIITVYT
jgi:hypothetical protein